MTTPRDAEVAALLRERHGYEVFGRKDRVEAVDRVLARIGYKPDDDKPKPDVETAEGEPGVEEAGGGSARRMSGRRG